MGGIVSREPATIDIRRSERPPSEWTGWEKNQKSSRNDKGDADPREQEVE